MSLPQNRLPSKTDDEKYRAVTIKARCCLITGSGRSAVAVVAVDGPEAIQAVSRCFQAASNRTLSAGQVRYGYWCGTADQREPGESVVVTPLNESNIEIHCHGGPAATARIMADLRGMGVDTVTPKEWNRDDRRLLIREAEEVLTRCLTARTAAIAMDQVRGAMQDWALRCRQATRRAGECLDVPGTPVGESLRDSQKTQQIGGRTPLKSGRTGSDLELERIRKEAESILAFAPLTLRLPDPLRIVLVGPPNVGKSSLLNAIVGYDRSITFDGAGTTRDVLHAETVIDGWPVRLSDTAGIRDSDEPIEREGVVRAHVVADEADLLLSVTEPALLDPTTGEAAIPVPPILAQRIPTIRILNKSDLWNRDSNAKRVRPGTRGAETNQVRFDLFTNAITGEGIVALIEMIPRRMGLGIAQPGAPVPVTERQADCLRVIANSTTPEQLGDAIRSLLGFDPNSEES